MSAPVTSSTFDAKKLTVSDAKKLDNGSSQVYINYAGGKLRLQAPRLPVPYDSGDYQGNGKHKVQFSFRDRATNKAVSSYISTLEAIDNFVIDQATKNAGKWFKMPGASREMIALFYTPTVKVSKDKDGNPKDYPPTQSVALKQRNGTFDAVLYNASREELEGITPVEALRRGAEVTPVVDATGIWIADKKFGLTWKLVQAMVNVAAEGGRGGCLIVEDGDAPAATNAVSAAEESNLMAAVMPSVSAAAVAEDDEEEDEDEVVEAPPVPVKPVAAAPKKVVKKVARA
ncbi:MAG: hypothetical protein EBT07_12715 [Actinobacteria bacterium]|nr:hypothetical protein [Actinomycetota bacterium]